MTGLTDTLRAHLQTLAAAPRPAGSPALARAQSHVEGALTACGWSVSREPFSRDGAAGVNLVAERGSSGRPLFTVTAHVDSVPDSPGADDNASAVAALLVLASALGVEAETSRVALRLVATDLEESGMLGAAHEAEHSQSAGLDLRGMVSLEMLGYRDLRPGSQNLPDPLRGVYPDTGNFIAAVGNARSRALTERFAGVMAGVEGLPVETLVVDGVGEALPPSRLSDHSPFWDRGLPALMVTDTSFFRNPHYHEASDTVETLDLEFLTHVTEGVIAAVRAEIGEG